MESQTQEQIPPPYRASEAAYMLNIKKLTLVRWIKKGKIPAFKVGPRADWRIEREVIDNIRFGK